MECRLERKQKTRQLSNYSIVSDCDLEFSLFHFLAKSCYLLFDDHDVFYVMTVHEY